MCSDPNATEEQNLNSTAAMTQTLQNDYSSAFANNQKILGNLTTTLNQAVAKPQGFTSGQMAALRTGAMDTTTGAYNQAKVNAGAAAARYGGDVASGVTGQIMGDIGAAEAGTESQQQNQITEANAELQQQNYWKAISGLSNVAAEYNPTSYANAATSSSGATTSAAAQTLAEQQAGWQDTFGVISGVAGLAGAVAGIPGLGGSGSKRASPFGNGAGAVQPAQLDMSTMTPEEIPMEG